MYEICQKNYFNILKDILVTPLRVEGFESMESEQLLEIG